MDALQEADGLEEVEFLGDAAEKRFNLRVGGIRHYVPRERNIPDRLGLPG